MEISHLILAVEYETIRFNELQRKIGKITYKTLSTRLKAMENDGLIIRKEYPQNPPTVEYSLSDKGKSLHPIMEVRCRWGMDNSGNKPATFTNAIPVMSEFLKE